MQSREVNKPKDVPPSHSQGGQEATRFTNFYRPEASQAGRQDASSSARHEALLRAQKLFEPGAVRPSQFVGSRPERSGPPPVTDSRTEEQKQADKEANLIKANRMFEPPEEMNTAGYLLDDIERDRGSSTRPQ
jgi:hypothetical protein